MDSLSSEESPQRLTRQQRSELSYEKAIKAHKLELNLHALILTIAGSALLDKPEDREVIGNGKEDRVLSLASDNSRRCVQFKTLGRQPNRPSSFRINIKRGYPPNIPLIAMTNEADLFFVAMRGDLPPDEEDKSARTIGMTLGVESPWQKFLYQDKERFVSNLLMILPHAIQELELNALGTRYSATELKAIKMIEWLRPLLAKRGLKFVGHVLTRDEGIDGWICNNTTDESIASTQLKFTSYKVADRYFLNLHRTVRGSNVPYSEDDGIDTYLVKIADYENDCLILPRDAMIKQQLTATSTQSGRISTTVPPPDYKRPNWMMQYWNRFDLLTTNTHVHTVDGFLKVISDYEDKGFVVESNPRSFCDSEITVNSRRIRIVQTATSDNEFSLQYYKDDNPRPIDIKDGIDGLLCILSSGTRYLIPTAALVYRNMISHGAITGKSHFILRENSWFSQFKEQLDVVFEDWKPNLEKEPVITRIVRICKEAGHDATIHYSGSSKWIMINGRRVSISTATTSSVVNFTLNFTTDPYAFIVYHTDDECGDCYVFLASDQKVVGKKYISISHSCWDRHKNDVACLYSMVATKVATISFPADIDRDKLEASIGPYGYKRSKINAMCKRYNLHFSNRISKGDVARELLSFLDTL